MVNGLGVLGWGVGGIEAEAAMLGQPVSMLIPLVVGVKLTGRLREGATATDLVLTITEMLRKHGVVGKFVEYFGPGLQDLPLADRATIANMAPEYGATCGIFPIDKESVRYLKLTGRSDEQIALVEAYAREQGLFHDAKTPEAEYSELLSLDLATVEPSLAGPKRPQDRVVLSKAGESFEKALPSLIKAAKGEPKAPANGRLHHGSVVIAAITSCTNTSNPSVLLAAGILAKKAVERGLEVPAWVKTSLAPGSKVVRDYLEKAGLTPYLEKLKFHIVGYGCTTCIGNSGPLPTEVSKEPVRNWQRDCGVQIYIGEFSAIRWAPDNSAYRYLKDLIDIFEAHDWDWTYHAFREWSGWSVEHGSDPKDTKPSAHPTDRQKLLLEWFAKNEKPKW